VSVGTRFDDENLLDALESLPVTDLDAIEFEFGLIVMDRSGTVLGYSQRESNRQYLAVQPR
jgi:hypothetical protein